MACPLEDGWHTITIRWNRDITIDIDNDADIPETMSFRKGDTSNGLLVANHHGESLSIDFGDGHVGFRIPSSYFEVIEVSGDV